RVRTFPASRGVTSCRAKGAYRISQRARQVHQAADSSLTLNRDMAMNLRLGGRRAIAAQLAGLLEPFAQREAFASHVRETPALDRQPLAAAPLEIESQIAGHQLLSLQVKVLRNRGDEIVERPRVPAILAVVSEAAEHLGRHVGDIIAALTDHLRHHNATAARAVPYLALSLPGPRPGEAERRALAPGLFRFRLDLAVENSLRFSELLTRLRQ